MSSADEEARALLWQQNAVKRLAATKARAEALNGDPAKLAELKAKTAPLLSTPG